MIYLEYNPSNGNHVEKTHEEVPAMTAPGNLIALSNDYNVGDEFEYYIVINEVNEEGIATSSSSVKQAPQASYLLQKLAEKDSEIEVLKSQIPLMASEMVADNKTLESKLDNAILELTMLIAMGGME